MRSIAGDLPVHVVSPKRNEGLDRVAAYLTPGRTGALLGSSGSGRARSSIGSSARTSRRHARCAVPIRQGPPHDDSSRARRPAERRVDDRHAGHARTAALGRRRRRARNLRRHRGARRRLSLHRLPAPRRAALRGEGRGGGGPARRGDGSRAISGCRTSWRSSRASRTSAPSSTRSAVARMTTSRRSRRSTSEDGTSSV